MDMTTITYDEYLYDVDSLLMFETGFPATNEMLGDVDTAFRHGMTPTQCARVLLEHGRRAA